MISKPVYLQQSEYSEIEEQEVSFFERKEVFDKHYNQVYRIVFRMTQSQSESEDITQDVFLKVFVKLASFNRNSSLETWIYRITVNTALDKLRWYKRFTKRELHSENIDDYTAEDNHANPHPSPNVLAALAKVKPKYRIVIILRDLEGFSYKEIADILDLSSGTVASRLSRGYSEMRKYLKSTSNNYQNGGE